MNSYNLNSSNSKLLKQNRPMIYGYTLYGALFSIIEEKDLPWVYSNFTQIMYHDDWRMIIFEDHRNLLENCPFLEAEYLMFDEERENKCSFIDSIIYMIDHGYYAYLFLDIKILQEKAKHNLAHTTLISGYDKEKHIFYLSDNYDNGKYVTLEVDMDIVEQAFHSAWTASTGNLHDNDNSPAFSYLRCITCFKYNNYVSSYFDKTKFTNQLECFLNSDSTSLFKVNTKNNNRYGYLLYNVVNDILSGKLTLKLGERDFHIIYEHKCMMKKRIEFMINKNIISPNDEFIRNSTSICNDFFVIRNLYLKSLFSHEKRREEIYLKMCEKINIAKECEKVLYENILFDIKRNKNICI